MRRFVVRNWQRLVDLSEQPGGRHAYHLAGSRAVIPARPLAHGPGPDRIADGDNRTLITGAARAVVSSGELHFYNRLYIFGPGGKIDAIYDKFHLVPFGEYVPFAALLSRIGIGKLTEGEPASQPAMVRIFIKFRHAPGVTPLICYEIIFPGAVTTNQRPGWLVNVTDDSWFGPWAGPMQHLSDCARARHRRGPAGGARRQHGNFGDDRSHGSAYRAS